MRHFKKIINRFSRTNILVLGDLILDEYIWGDVSRISPEAPVPVVWANKRSCILGGAANVANNLKSLGASVSVCGVLGRDENAYILRALLKKEDISCNGIFLTHVRHTTVKTRIIAGHQQVVRVDWEHTEPLSQNTNARLYAYIKKNIHRYDAIIIEDYGKGVINPGLIKSVIQLARSENKIITADPKEEHFQYYTGTTCITPNLKEAESAVRSLKMRDTTNAFKAHTDRLLTSRELEHVGKELLRYLQLKSLLITLGEEGMCLFEGTRVIHIPTQAQQVFDVSGAGDTVIAVFTLGLACGASQSEAAHIANFAAGIVVSKVGTATVSRQELLKRVR